MSVFLQLFHGRKDPAEDMEDWGRTGPTLGPFDYVHVTYLSCVKFGCDKSNMEANFGMFGDLLYYDGWYYGDFTVTSQPTETTEPVDPNKLAPPPAAEMSYGDFVMAVDKELDGLKEPEVMEDEMGFIDEMQLLGDNPRDTATALIDYRIKEKPYLDN